jgi:signal transduction histidine kinase/CheY-like chemotaxis protein
MAPNSSSLAKKVTVCIAMVMLPIAIFIASAILFIFKEMGDNNVIILIVIFILFALLGYGLIMFLRRAVISPIIMIEDIVNQIGNGHYVYFSNTNRKDELGRIQRGINQMTQELWQRQIKLESSYKELIDQRNEMEAQNEEIVSQQEEQLVTVEKLIARDEELTIQAVMLEDLNIELSKEKRMLQEQGELIERIISSVHEGIMICNPKGEILFVNQRMDNFFDYANFTGESVDQFFNFLQQKASTKSTAISVHVNDLLKGKKEVFQEKFDFADTNGKLSFYDLYVSSIKDREEGSRRFLFVFRDRSEEEKTDEMKNEFVSIVSHELRTPLASILGFMEIMMHREIPKEKQQKYIETIYKEAQRLSNLINDFLDLRRMESGSQVYQLIPLNIVDIIKDVSEHWRGQTHHINLHGCEEPCYVSADRDGITQVIHNLISNAVKYSPQSDKVDIFIRKNNGIIFVDIQDYGLGIPEEAKDKLFSKFYRVDNSDRRQIGGTGLGLSIVKGIMEALQGSFSFSSNFGLGSTFSIQLNQHQIKAVQDKVVILEDDEILSGMITVALEGLNLPVVHMRSAEEAILSLSTLEGRPPLLCIVDILLSGHLNGWDFINEMVRHPQCIYAPIIVSTVLEQPQNYQEKATERFLQKPFSVNRLVELIRELLFEQMSKPNFVFPYQNETAITTSLHEIGMKVKEMKIRQDVIEVNIIEVGSEEHE